MYKGHILKIRLARNAEDVLKPWVFFNVVTYIKKPLMQKKISTPDAPQIKEFLLQLNSLLSGNAHFGMWAQKTKRAAIILKS